MGIVVRAAFAALVSAAWVSNAAADTTSEPVPPPGDVQADREVRKAQHGFEAGAVILGQVTPKPFYGVRLAYSIGNESFQLRLGGTFAGAPKFALGQAHVTNVFEVGQVDVCAGKVVQRHQIRMCIGGQAGAWQHVWRNPQRPKRKVSPWVAGTLEANYRLGLGERFGILFAVGVAVPVVGPTFQGTDQYGIRTPLLIPGPVGGQLSLGASFRVF